MSSIKSDVLPSLFNQQAGITFIVAFLMLTLLIRLGHYSTQIGSTQRERNKRLRGIAYIGIADTIWIFWAYTPAQVLHYLSLSKHTEWYNTSYVFYVFYAIVTTTIIWALLIGRFFHRNPLHYYDRNPLITTEEHRRRRAFEREYDRTTKFNFNTDHPRKGIFG